jgi:hypothetical protein
LCAYLIPCGAATSAPNRSAPCASHCCGACSEMLVLAPPPRPCPEIDPLPWCAQLARETTVLVKSYTLPDGRTIKVGPERFAAPEVLFNPRLANKEQPGLAQIAFQCIQVRQCCCIVVQTLQYRIAVQCSSAVQPYSSAVQPYSSADPAVQHCNSVATWQCSSAEPPLRVHDLPVHPTLRTRGKQGWATQPSSAGRCGSTAVQQYGGSAGASVGSSGAAQVLQVLIPEHPGAVGVYAGR